MGRLRASVLHFERPGRVRCVTNFGAEPIALPAGDVLLSSVKLVDGRLPTDATAWLRMLALGLKPPPPRSAARPPRRSP